MALVVFRSRASAQVIMMADVAQQIFDCLQLAPAPRGVITTEQLPQAIARLEQAMRSDSKQRAAAQADASEADAAQDDGPGEPRVALAQRIYPVLDMLRAAQARQVEVTWGV